jgi:hypothetical protein
MYAFQVFSAIYGYCVIESEPKNADVVCTYGLGIQQGVYKRVVRMAARYRPRGTAEPALQAARHRHAGEDFFLFHGRDEANGQPDWLGEIFEWLTASHELVSETRDAVGRIPYAATVFGSQNISPRKPHANLLMAWLQSAIEEGVESEALPAPSSPAPDADHLVVSSHDLDFYWSGQSSALARLAKNMGVALRLYQSREYFASSASMMRDVLRGRRVGDYLPALLHAAERYNFRSTLFAVARRGHRRDPNYCIEQMRERLKDAAALGFPVALHGSYSSVVEDASLAEEARMLARAIGNPVRGGRQHWLRFDRHKKLFDSVKNAGLTFDSTLGFADTAGFRNGASFAFPPYDFEREAAYEFLEVPLVLMDGNLEATARTSGENPAKIADEILQASRRWGWGGIAALWHNPIEPLSVPQKINDIFWKCVNEQDQFREKWFSTDDFLSRTLSRYQNAGLLKGVRADA